MADRRRVVFLGARLRQKLFAYRPAVGQTVRIGNVRFTVIGTMGRKIQLSNYFTSDDDAFRRDPDAGGCSERYSACHPRVAA